jgi:hypothetical protein
MDACAHLQQDVEHIRVRLLNLICAARAKEQGVSNRNAATHAKRE